MYRYDQIGRIERISPQDDDKPPRQKKRKLRNSGVSQEIKAVCKSIGAFASDLFRVVANDKEGNYVCSSLSAHVALAMTAYGAEGTTRKQMFDCFHLPSNDKLAHKGFDGFLNALNNMPGVILQVANKIYTSKDCSIKDGYKEILDEIFHSEFDSLDFSKTAEVISTVNAWCNEKTKGKIEGILTQDDVTRDMVFILLNVVYFNGNWQSRFSRFQTCVMPFNINATTTVEVPMMRKLKYLPYKDLVKYNAECIAIPYKNENLSMIIVLPKDINGLKLIETNWDKIISECSQESFFEDYVRVNLSLPRFKIETQIPLEKYLRQLGLDEMFGNEANFKSISDTFIKITSVKQKVFIEVNEEGTEAAAITGQCGGGGPPPKPVEFHVDRPFLFQIYDRNLQMTLFNGRIVNPKAK